MEMSKDREDKITAYLREYITLGQKYAMYITAAIGANTMLWDADTDEYKTTFNEELRNNVGEMVYGDTGAIGLFADDGDHAPPREQLDRIWKNIQSAFKE